MLLKGFTIGMLISAPMGPVGILCIQRTLNKGRWQGFFTGVGAAGSDLFYCLLTGLGMSFVTNFVEANKSLLQIIGSVVLLIYSVYLLRSKSVTPVSKKPEGKTNYWQDSLTGFLFTLSNPLIVFLIIGLFAQFSFTSPDLHFYHYIAGYLAIIAGALSWWFFISTTVNAVRSHFNLRSMWLINRIIGLIILVMSAIGLISGISDFI
jgi:Putative threonine efflux protein